MPSPPIVALGDASTVEVFAAFGIRVVCLEAADAALPAVRAAATDPDVRIIFITEPVYRQTAAYVESLRDRPIPAITLIPTVGRNEHIAADQLRTAVRTAIGSEIV